MSTGALELDEKAVRDEHGAEAGAPIEARSPLELFWSRLRKDRVALAGLAFIVLMVVVAVAAPLIV